MRFGPAFGAARFALSPTGLQMCSAADRGMDPKKAKARHHK